MKLKPRIQRLIISKSIIITNIHFYLDTNKCTTDVFAGYYQYKDRLQTYSHRDIETCLLASWRFVQILRELSAYSMSLVYS